MCIAPLLSGLVLALGPAEAAHGQTREEMERCRAIEDETRRLACYDAIQLAPSGPISKYEAVSLEELKEFALSYRGHLVEVEGWIKLDDRLLLLGVDAGDERPVPVDFELLPRRDREMIVEQCGTGCEATVRGRVRPVNFTTGIVADVIIVH
jgi:hypothetical protein